MPNADSLSSSDLIAYFGKKLNFEVSSIWTCVREMLQAH